MWYGVNGLITTAALGTPPQPFRLVVNLVWNTLFVPNASINLEGWERDFYRLYYPNESSTAAPSDLGRRSVEHGWVEFSGPVVEDTFRINGGEVARQPFIAAERWRYEAIHLWMLYDGVLGLSPRFGVDSEMIPNDRLPSPWSRMVEEGVLDANLFAIEVPRGDLSFGAINTKYNDAQFTSLPLVRDDDRLWAVEAHLIRWDNQTHPIERRFDDVDDDDDDKNAAHEEEKKNTIAVFTTEPIIAIPDTAFVRKIYRSIPAWAWKERWQRLLDCAALDHLPDLVFELGGGQTFAVTARQYAYPVRRQGEVLCHLGLHSTAFYKGCYYGSAPRGAVVLGTPFLNAYYSVYDLDKMEVRFTLSKKRRCFSVSVSIQIGVL
ncbi:hypothetical protein PG996_004689 [Apiospora saccharicola]|uniref:Peptidase A1 domain-containing protein n=1 Tax=Apiospora saccharicola TaxID=335842 RepID=A0ABR1W4W7_9PEZI